jgi:DNA-directed RNA polymerase specialized sigma24 family protein
LSDQDETAAAAESDQKEILAGADLTSFIEMFDAHAASLFDYCNGLLGDQEEAARATEAILIAAHSLLQDREKMRTWLFALARRECMVVSPERTDGTGAEPSGTAQKPTAHVYGEASHRTGELALNSAAYDADTEDLPVAGASAAGSGSPGEARPPLSALPQRQREALNLVYRHGILPDDLATVLGVPREEAQALLESAEAGFGRSADAAPGFAVVRAEETKTFGREQVSGFPLATIPPSIWRGTTTTLFGIEFPGRGDGARTARKRPGRSGRQPGPSAKGRNRLRIVAAALIPVAAAVAGLLYLTHPLGAASSPGGAPASATPPVDAAGSSRAAAASSHNTAERGPARHNSAAFPAQPAPGTDAFSSTKPKPSRSATPTNSPGSPSPTTSLSAQPSPSPSPSPSSPPPSTPPPSSSPSSSPSPS